MYGRLGRRRATRGIADAHAREVPVEAHEGSCADFLRRHEQEASRVALGTRRERREFAACLFRRVADSRNIRLAIEVTASKGKAPGPDGIRESDLSNRDRWNLTRKIAEQFQDRDWTPGQVRTTLIPKTSGRGTRPIRVQNFEDRVHETAIRQIVQPFLDPTFLGTSLAFRPRKSREEALAIAERLALDESRGTWICQDLDNAFENVPHDRLFDSLRQQLFADDLLDLLHRVVANERGKGIRQGGPLSPLLLNGYLHTTFDLRWRRDPHRPPALRYADDILLLCRDRTQAAEASQDLAQAMHTPGFTLKHSPDEAICLLEEGQVANWIGFDIRLRDRTLGVEIARKSWR
jgi:RNA-directed DNA polymerase